MLDPENVWVDEFKKLKPQKTPIQGIMQLADTVEKLTNKVDPLVPGGQVSPGIFKFNKAIFIAQMMSLTPTQGPEWIQTIAAAWGAACSAGIITPGLVNAPSIWPVSTLDVTTLPIAAATVPTVAAGQAVLAATLAAVPAVVMSDASKSPEMFAKAFRNAVSAFTFILIGISGTQVSPTPLPFPAKAQ